MVSLSWHGGPSYSLRFDGLEVLVDPLFSRPGDYPPWFDADSANAKAPGFADYLDRHRPDYLFITHGHFDHFDLKTVERLAEAVPGLRLVGSDRVLETARDLLGITGERLIGCPRFGDGWLELGVEPVRADARPARRADARPVRSAALPAPHWFTGEEGDRIAAKLAGRPDRYGAMPCGGPMLGFVFDIPVTAGSDSETFRLWASGDTEPPGFPAAGEAGPFDAAVVCCGGKLQNPATKQIEGPFLDEGTLAGLLHRYIRPRVVVPVHYDLPVFQTGFDPARLAAELDRNAAGGQPHSRVLVPPYNTWVELGTGTV